MSIRNRAGLFVDDGAVALASVGRSGLAYVRRDADENLGAGLRGEIESQALRARGVRVGLRRARVIVKAIDLPAAMRGNLGEMVGFELERHVPFPPEEMAWSWRALPSSEGPTLKVLVAACERRVIDQTMRLLEEARLRPLSITVACHDLPGLLARGARPARAAWAHRTAGGTDLVMLSRGRVRLSRTVGAREADALAREIAGSLSLLNWPGAESIWISGDDAAAIIEGFPVGDLGARPSAPPLAADVATRVGALPPDQAGPALLALAAALGSRRPDLDLLPPEQRPRRMSPGHIATAASATLALLLGASVFWVAARRDEGYLNRLHQAIRALDPEVRAVERLTAEAAQKKRLLGAIKNAERSSLNPLPFLRELTDTVPGDAWITALNVDTKGVEITGQAGAANQLIPALESSRWLERVEFTSPVTRGRDKEQFRLKAAWEAGPRGPVAMASASAPPPPPAAAAAPARPTAPGPASSPAPASSPPPAPPPTGTAPAMGPSSLAPGATRAFPPTAASPAPSAPSPDAPEPDPSAPRTPRPPNRFWSTRPPRSGARPGAPDVRQQAPAPAPVPAPDPAATPESAGPVPAAPASK